MLVRTEISKMNIGPKTREIDAKHELGHFGRHQESPQERGLMRRLLMSTGEITLWQFLELGRCPGLTH